MRNIPHNIRIAVKSGNSVPATVIDTVGNRVSVRLSGRGAIYRNLLLVGGPVLVGDQVHVDFTTTEPTVVAPGVNWNAKLEELEFSEYESESGASETVISTNGPIQRLANSVTLVATYPGTADGLTTAFSECNSNDLVLIPTITLTGNFTVPANVKFSGYSRILSIIYGKITLSSNTTMEKVRVQNNSSGSDAVAVLATGSTRVNDCDILACNCLEGAARGFMATGGASAISACSISGEGFPGYGISASGGTITVRDTLVYGTTSLWEGTNIYVYGTLEGSAICDCSGSSGSGGEAPVGEAIFGGMAFSGWGGNDLIYMPYEVGHVFGFPPNIVEWNSFAISVSINSISVAPENVAFYAMCSSNIYRSTINSGSSALTHTLNAQSSSTRVMNCVSEFGVYTMATTGVGLVFSYLDFSTETATETDLYTYSSGSFGGYIFYPNFANWLTRMQYGLKDYLIGSSTWITSGSDQKAISRVFVFDLATETIVSNDFIPMQPTLLTYANPGQIFTHKPNQYRSKLIWSVGTSNDLGTSVRYTHFIYGIETGSLSRIDLTRGSGVTSESLYSAALDASSGKYYVAAHWAGAPGGGGHVDYIDLSINSSTPTTIISGNTNQYRVIRGSEHAYLLQMNYVYSPFEWNYKIYTLPDLTYRGKTHDLYLQFIFPDDDQGVLWEPNSISALTSITGHSVTSQPDTAVIPTWNALYHYSAYIRLLWQNMLFLEAQDGDMRLFLIGAPDT